MTFSDANVLWSSTGT